MRIIAILFLLLLISPAFSELTKEDLRTVVKEEVTASEKRMREYIDLKIDALDKSLNARIDATNARIDALDKSLNARIDATNARIDSLEKNMADRFDAVADRFDAVDNTLDRMWWLMIGFIGLIAAAIAVPQIIIAYRDRGQKEMQTEIQQLRERLEALENTPS